MPGYHDEPLKGDRAGQRSIQLSRSYRAIYEIKKDGTVEFVSVEEVNKHDYESCTPAGCWHPPSHNGGPI